MYTYPECDAGWKQFTGKCYKYSSLKTNRTEAFRYCKSSNENPSSTLVSIPNNETNNFLLTLTIESAWTGGYRKSDGVSWGWTDGSPWTFSNWSPGEPNNYSGEDNFVEINVLGPTVGLWNDDPDVRYARGALCQYELVFEPTDRSF